MAESPDSPLLRLAGVTKRFAGTIALQGIDLDIHAGEVHALVGENGAGKSTLGKLLFGGHPPTTGQLYLDGNPINLASPAEGLQYGLVGIAQELSLIPTLSVADNIVLARESGFGPFINQAANRRRVLEIMEQYDLKLDPDALVWNLPIADQQRVEILRALSGSARLIVFDEPTARLAGHDAQAVREVVRQLAAAGCAVVYVSHFLEEVLSLADRITLLRNGERVRTALAADETRHSLIEGMTGKNPEAQFPAIQTPETHAPAVLLVENLQLSAADVNKANEGHDVNHDACGAVINFTIHAGEILGLYGLVGAGRSAIAHAILGATPARGAVKLAGQDVSALTIHERIAAGMAFIPENRRDQGLCMTRPIQENVSLPYLKKLSGWLGLAQQQEKHQAEQHCAITTVKYQKLSLPVANLSGGNQQKVLFARASLGDPELLIVDEPTRGVDVGAKRKIYDLIVARARAGVAVLLISSELEEILGLCHRVEVLAKGRQVKALMRNKMREEILMRAAFSGV